MHGAGLPVDIWGVNVAALVVGSALTALLMTRPAWTGSARVILETAALVAAVVLLTATLAMPGSEGVRRWLPLGPLQLHMAAALLPPLVVILLEARWVTAVCAATLVLSVLAMQPDAAQAGAFCAAWIGIAVSRQETWAKTVIAASLVLATVAIVRPDPLEPVAHVEGIVGLAATRHITVGAVAVLSLVLIPLALARGLPKALGAGLACYVIGLLLAAWLGHHPVPMLGYGVSPILGYYGALSVAALLGRLASASSAG